MRGGGEVANPRYLKHHSDSNDTKEQDSNVSGTGVGAGQGSVMKPAELKLKWRQDVDAIRDDLVDLHFIRQMFQSLVDIAQKNKRLQQPNTFFQWLFRNYVTTAMLGVRRHTDKDPDSSSLAGLIIEISANAGVLTQTAYVAQFHLDLKALAESEYSKWAAADGVSLDTKKFEADLDSLKHVCDPIRKYVNKRIAHLDSKPIQWNLTRRDIDLAIDKLGTLIEKYYLFILLKGAQTEPVVPAWDHILRVPWIESDPETKQHAEQLLGPVV